MTIKCAACHRKSLADSKYCIHHKEAFDSINDHYMSWVNAYGGISREEFLSKLSAMQETGSWIKEVIEVESKK